MDITLIVKASNQQFDDLTIKCETSWTIRRLKGHLTEVYPGKPRTDEQKLIYSGQLLADSVVLKDILRHYDGQQTHTVHLVFTPKNNRHRDFNSGATTASASSNSSGSAMPPKSSDESGATSTHTTAAPPGSRVESTRSPETGISGTYGADGLRQRNVTGNQNINTASAATTMDTNPIPPASADYIMGQQLAMQNWMQQAYMQYLNQYMNVISNGQNPQALYASAPTNTANPIIPQSSPQTNVAQQLAQPSQTLPNLAYYPYLSTMSSSPMPSASSIPAPITSSGTIPTSPSPVAPAVTPDPSSQPTIPSPVSSPAGSAGPSPSGSSASSPAPTATSTASTTAVQQDVSAQAAAPAAAAPVAAPPAAAAPARRFPNIVVEEQENRDWLDIFFSMCRVGILMTVVYLYSSPTRCLAVFFVGVMLYLYQMGFFRNDRADRMEFARRLVVQQINMAHMMRQRAEQARARAAPAPAPAAAAAEEAAANAQAQSPAAPGAAPSTAQNDETDGSKTTTEDSDSPAQPEETTTESSSIGEEVPLVDASSTVPEANRVNINDVAAFLRTMVLSFITSIIPDTPAA